jgi:MoxR-like ATPase
MTRFWTTWLAQERYTVRDGINIARYALKRLNLDHSLKDRGITKQQVIKALKEAASRILDENAAEYFSTIIDIYGKNRSI